MALLMSVVEVRTLRARGGGRSARCMGGVDRKARRTWPPRLFDVRAALAMSKPVVLLGVDGGAIVAALVPRTATTPRSQALALMRRQSQLRLSSRSMRVVGGMGFRLFQLFQMKQFL